MKRRSFVKKSVAAAIVAATPLALTGLVNAAGGGGGGGGGTDSGSETDTTGVFDTTGWFDTTVNEETTAAATPKKCGAGTAYNSNEIVTACVSDGNGKFTCTIRCNRALGQTTGTCDGAYAAGLIQSNQTVMAIDAMCS